MAAHGPFSEKKLVACTYRRLLRLLKNTTEPILETEIIEMLALGCLLLFVASVAGETVYLESLNSESYRRSQGLGLPETLNFRLRHNEGELELNFQENVNLNANAPIFLNRRGNDGDSVAVKVDVPKTQMKYFQDKRNGAYVRSTCFPGEHGPCFGTLHGNIVINGKEYKLEPANLGTDKRHSALGVPHNIEVLERVHSTGIHQTVDGQKVMVAANDYVVREDEEKNEEASDIPNLATSDLDRLERLIARLEHKQPQHRHKRQIVAHGIELVLAIDHLVYNQFAAINAGQSVENILLSVREYYSHIVNGVDLRYASIQEDDVSFYVTVAGFSISTREADSPWLDYSGGGPTDGLAGLSFMRFWRRDTEGLPEHDHAAFITGSDIQASGSTGVVGIAYLDGVCSFFGVSINEEFGFFQGAGVLAHELGHNLGAPHDSGNSGSNCDPNADFIMAPFVPSLSASSTTINPWRFSECSIESFRTYVNSLGSTSCTLDRATIYDEEEFAAHNSSLAGKLYTEDEQCELLRGDGARFCSNNRDTPNVCRTFGCASAGSNSCFRYVAAHGTPCGNGLVCFEGLCQLEDTTNAPTNPPTTAAPTNPPTTAAPTNPPTEAPTSASPTNPPTEGPTSAFPTTDFPTTTSSTPMPTTTEQGLQCEDFGTNNFSCDELRFLFGNNRRMCRRFSAECCETCSDICNRDRTVRGRERYTCDDLIDIFGLNETCSIFAYECCFTCHVAKKR